MNIIEVKTDDLIGAALDWAVAKIEGYDLMRHPFRRAFIEGVGHVDYRPSTDWAVGGPLIDKYEASVGPDNLQWSAHAMLKQWIDKRGDTPLIAICRSIVAAKLGDTVQVPAELLP